MVVLSVLVSMIGVYKVHKIVKNKLNY